jgi:hypothetical protein
LKDVFSYAFIPSIGKKSAWMVLNFHVFSSLNVNNPIGGTEVERDLESLVFEVAKPGFYFDFRLHKI